MKRLLPSESGYLGVHDGNELLRFRVVAKGSMYRFRNEFHDQVQVNLVGLWENEPMPQHGKPRTNTGTRSTLSPFARKLCFSWTTLG